MTMRRVFQCMERLASAIHMRHLYVFGLFTLTVVSNTWGQSIKIPIVSSVGKGEVKPENPDFVLPFIFLILMTVLCYFAMRHYERGEDQR